MASKRRVVVAGGTGVFGRHFARELRRDDTLHLVIAARDGPAARRFARELGGDSEAAQLDLRDFESLRRLAGDSFAVVCLAGPFSMLDPAASAIVASAGAHWLDISDDAAWVDNLLTNPAIDSGGPAVIPGLSSVPALSGILARLALRQLPSATRAAITLFIGNRNAKGAGAIASAISAPPATATINLQLPFGRRTAFRSSSPDSLLLRRELNLDANFHVAFQWSVATSIIRTFRALPLTITTRLRIARLLSAVSSPFNRLGTDLGGVDVLVTSDDASYRLRFVSHGQRLAILPAAIVLRALATGEITPHGAHSPALALPLDTWLQRLESEGVRLENVLEYG